MSLLAFVFLQAMDVLTTLLFLHNGVTEANPLIRAVLAGPVHPGLSLLLAKCFSVALATFAWRSGRTNLLSKMNLLFAACVAWNLVAALAGPAAGVAG
jgi:hypothetical protein